VGVESDAQVALRRHVSLSRAANTHLANRVVVAWPLAALLRKGRFVLFAGRQLLHLAPRLRRETLF
jgi:hypothetical protein